MSRTDLKHKRTLIYKPEVLTEKQIKCIKCGKPAKVTFYNEDWDELDLCQTCWDLV